MSSQIFSSKPQLQSNQMDRGDNERLAIATDVFETEYPASFLGGSLYVAAGLRAYLARQAALPDTARLQQVANEGRPCLRRRTGRGYGGG
jgi:hypothetical protein